MKSIRGNLFLSVGIILLIVAALNYFIPRFFVAKDINSASSKLLQNFNQSQKKIQEAVTSWISSHFIQQASQLHGLSEIIEDISDPQEQKQSLWVTGAEFIELDPSLAYVQISDPSGEEIAISPETGKMYSPSWTSLNKEMLLIELPENHQFFIALPDSYSEATKQTYYYLYPIEHADVKTTMKTFDQQLPAFSPSMSTEELYQYQEWKQQLLITKAEMINKLAPWQGKTGRDYPVGMLAVDTAFKQGYCLVANEVFLQTPIIKKTESNPFLFILKNGEPFLNLGRFLTLSNLNIWLAYSLTPVAEEIANTLQKPLVLSIGKSENILFPPNAPSSLISAEDYSSNGTFLWQGITYQSRSLKLGPLSISLLIPEKEVNAIPHLMSNLQESLIHKVSFNLLAAALIVLVIALGLLARISKRITRPITQLAKASEEIGRGKYEGVNLPKIDKRKDEIAVLTHSFEGMVLALRDREKIRGVLNKVVSKEVASEILKSNIELGGEERVVTLLFSDIRNFTSLSNTLNPKEVIELLNDYMTRMCHVLDETHGVVDKFVGDEIMALYGAPLPLEDHAEKGIEAAIKMMNVLHEWNKERNKTVEIGIGVHTGAVCSGNMGAENRLNYTVIGANVNLASRLCSAAKPMQILVSQETKEAAEAASQPKKYTFQELSPLTLKGFDQPVPVFELSWNIGLS